MNYPYVYIYSLFFGFPSHLGHHRAVSSRIYVESEKIGIDDLICKAEIETQTQNKCMDTKKESREGGMNGEIGTDIYTLLILRIK